MSLIGIGLRVKLKIFWIWIQIYFHIIINLTLRIVTLRFQTLHSEQWYKNPFQIAGHQDIIILEGNFSLFSEKCLNYLYFLISTLDWLRQNIPFGLQSKTLCSNKQIKQTSKNQKEEKTKFIGSLTHWEIQKDPAIFVINWGPAVLLYLNLGEKILLQSWVSTLTYFSALALMLSEDPLSIPYIVWIWLSISACPNTNKFEWCYKHKLWGT